MDSKSTKLILSNKLSSEVFSFLEISCHKVIDLGGGIKIVELLYKSNLMALVGGGRNPKFPPNKVIIWDDYQGQIVGEITLAPDSKILAVRLRQHKSQSFSVSCLILI